MKVKLKLIFNTRIIKNANVYVCYNENYNIAGYGKTERKAKKSFRIVANETILNLLENSKAEQLKLLKGWKELENSNLDKKIDFKTNK